MVTHATDDVNIGSGNGLVPPGTKSLPEPMLNKIFMRLTTKGIGLYMISLTRYNMLTNVFGVNKVLS